MFDDATRAAVAEFAARERLDPAGILAVAEVESGGKAFALVDGRPEPLIRFEGHYFDRRLSGDDLAAARAAGLASPVAGAVKNPKSQAARWRLLARAAEIDAQAAYESVSWGVGQVMGAHWAWLGFGSVTELVNLCRRDVAGQIDLMTRFIDKAGLAGSLRARDWTAFARGYNGPAYARLGYDRKIAAAYARYAGPGAAVAPSVHPDHSVKALQRALNANGFQLAVDGIRGKRTNDAIEAFQQEKGLVVDGIAGSATWKALDAG